MLTLLFVGFMLIALNLYLGEICSRTKGRHQLVGYAERYLGSKGKKLMTVSVLVGVYGALIAYIIGVGASLNAIFGINSAVASLAFFAVGATLVYLGLKTVSSWELFLGSAVLAIIVLIFFFSLGHFNTGNLAGFDWRLLFLPYGVIFFAFIGTAAIPEMKGVLEHSKDKLKRAIIIGSAIPIVAYALFTVGVLAVTGINTTEIATIGLGKALGSYMVVAGNLFAIVAMSTSFLALGLALVWVYNYDYKMKKSLSWALTVFPPLAVALSGLAGFIQVIGVTGAIAGGIDGVLIVLMHRRAKKFGELQPAYVIRDRWFVSALLCLVFVGGIIYTVANF